MTNITALSELVEVAWEQRSSLNHRDHMDHITAIHDTLRLLDNGTIRVAEKKDNAWHVHQWIKKAILLSFRVLPMQLMTDSHQSRWYDKVRAKWYDWNAEQFQQAGFRAVPDCRARHSAYIAPGVVLMPSFINVGARIEENTMVDTWSTIGSCAQIGKNCHISGGVGIGGVLEPLQANPVIIEDNCFIGARSEIAEGVIVEKGSVIAMGTFISASTKIIDRTTGDIIYGHIPPYSVIVPGSIPTKNTSHDQPIHLNCAVIIKKVDEKTRSKTDLNELLRD